MQALKSVADFYPQGVRGIRKAAEPPTAAQASTDAKYIGIRFSGGVYTRKTLRAPHVSQSPYGRQGTKRSASFSKKRDAAFSCVPLF